MQSIVNGVWQLSSGGKGTKGGINVSPAMMYARIQVLEFQWL